MKMGLLTAYGISTDCTGGMKMKKVWYVLSVSVLLIALILGGALSAAANTTNAGNCGDKATWSFGNGVLTISGEGAMKDYENNAPWLEYKDQITSVVIGEKITAIGETAFSGLNALETVTLEKNSQLKTIGKGAFYGCSKLTSVSVPAGVTAIGDWAFYGCAKLNQIDFCGVENKWNAIEKGNSWNTAAGEYKVNYLHDISYGKWVDCKDNPYHKKACAQCSTHEIYANHTWTVNKVVAATHTKPGNTTYECVCGAIKEEPIAEVSGCTYSGFEMIEGDAVNHKKVCACGEKIDENHSWKTVSTINPTHTSEGVKIELCAGCGMTKTTSIAKTTAHTYNTLVSVGAEKHKGVCACGEETTPVAHVWGKATVEKQPTHTEYGLQTYTCSCGETKFEIIAPKADAHKYGKWTSYGDDTQHKQVCDCGAVIYGVHSWDDGKVTTAATHLGEGVRTYTCTGCGQTKTETIPATPEHTCENWVQYNDAQHKAECAECNEIVLAAHEWDEGVVQNPQTHVSAGEMKYTCKGCGKEKIESIPAGHAYSEWKKSDATQHKAECSCGHVIYEDHAWGKGVVTKDATHTATGETTFTCEICGQTKTERIEKTLEHTYSSQWSKDASKHWHVCECGAKSDEAEHSYGDWICQDDDMHKKVCDCGSEILGIHKWEIKTVDPTCAKEGQKIYTCSDCGEKNVLLIDKLNHTYGEWTKHDDEQHKKVCSCGDKVLEDHAWSRGEVIAEATEQAEGKMKYVCKGCGCEEIEVIPKLNASAEAGCGATVAGGAALMLLLSIGSAALVYKKKED